MIQVFIPGIAPRIPDRTITDAVAVMIKDGDVRIQHGDGSVTVVRDDRVEIRGEQEFDRRHAERYAKIMRREMTLAEALAENEKDWRALVTAGIRDRVASDEGDR